MKPSIFTLAFLVTISLPALAHEKGTIRLASKAVGVGGELVLRGEKLPKNATLRLQLRGTLETFPLSEVRTNASGIFQARLALPLTARIGSYTVAVLAPDGDVVAQADLNVVAASAPAAQMTPMEHAEMTPKEHATMNTSPQATDMPHASAEMMEVQVSTTGAEWVGILAIILASVGGGAALLLGALRGKA
ncbi:MAG: hypothetical protein ACREOG_05710 [Gemmatimonadaceae bacterium]